MMKRDKLLSKRTFCWVKSLIVAVALSAAAWNSGPHARVASDYDDVSYTDDAGPQRTDAAASDAANSEAETAQGPEGICSAIDHSAADNELPVDFLTRLIWQESRFNPRSVSHAGAQGIAQFMPGTARMRGLADPFDPLKAIPKSAELLRDLVGQFGNVGLAAAAYNAGPGRIVQWLTGRKALPKETQDYVRIITGRPAEDWTAAEPAGSDPALKTLPPCNDLLAIAQSEERTRKVAAARPPAVRPAIIALRSTQQRRGNEVKVEWRVASQRPVRVAEARDMRAHAHPRPNLVTEVHDTRSHVRPRLLSLVAERAHAGRPKRLAHAL